ncbi:carbamoyl-phosphate synthase, small subunit [Lactobacillus selangorensis]|uniref:Carbamoyl phosphate synthase small chain n=1 Tax=Lactobacillus selangorensis TaxID=81857 RepID=A0A0R2G282_9LACO|nr:carbamoyl phosphate synthase small subunit [Lactobacillus selangorensis]KRN29475.1 carbamoyl-phosphate synthase, small subunit [Lactobacillus selangorensis]KRN33995.1 carbamoyl-phosphate synthase, small subunit [Lactobacillus selangorensis]
MKRYLILEDGSVFPGRSFGAPLTTTGEIVFTTGMTGYQETITDPSHNGQIIAFTNPQIGNVGINRADYESIKPTCKGVVVRSLDYHPHHHETTMSLDAFLKQEGIPGIEGVDTRALTRRIRTEGAMKASLVDAADEHAFDQLKALVMPKDQVQQVATTKPYPSPADGHRVVVIDLGLKHGLLKMLAHYNCNVTVLPYKTDAKKIFALAPDGVLLSNGPGNPHDIHGVAEMIQAVEGKIPVFAIGLGHELFAMANGAATYKMKFGHHGFNHPVREIATGRIDFTAQNHGYAVDPASINNDQLLVTHIETNDKTIEGLRHRLYPAFSVQFDPEGTPGPHDAIHLFDEFMEMIDAFNLQKQRRQV